jgi:hypothetical protein
MDAGCDLGGVRTENLIRDGAAPPENLIPWVTEQ